MNYLHPDQVLFIHARIIAETGGSHGVRDLTMLESAVNRPQSIFEGQDLYPDLFTKAAALLDSMVNNHPFVDGNKRTGITTAALFLLINGHKLIASNTELETFTLNVATARPSISELASWLQTHSTTLVP